MPAEVRNVPQSGRDQPINPTVLKTLRALQREGRPDILATLISLFLDSSRGLLNDLETAAKSVRELRVAEVVRQDLTIQDGAILNYRIRLGISFKYDPD